MLKRLILTVALVSVLPVGAHAATALATIGPRVGFSVDPDQLVVGGQIGTSEIARNLTFDPNVELGFGDDVTLVALNFDLHYRFEISGTDWRPYAGFGLGVNFVSWDAPAPFEDQSDTEIGGNVIVGSQIPTGSSSRMFGELKLGLGDIPTLKLLVGWNFPLGR